MYSPTKILNVRFIIGLASNYGFKAHGILIKSDTIEVKLKIKTDGFQFYSLQ